MKNKEELKKVVLKVLSLDEDRNKMEEYLCSIDEELVYELYAVYYTGRDGKIELGSIDKDVEYNLKCSKYHTPGELLDKIIDNIMLNKLIPIGMKLLEL
ncbi:hypothetical protein [Psychrilyobacter sp.]|uniref:hypothetical protein n=1 Tax=Psychrilyobacter sp. TaxID=2586924 RepID=UPI0030185049